ncbi:MAG: FKBP-type peptidyl-prolyl cis-trans isomerase [Buchnera aphidicola (Nurudea yanoniella)]
MLFFLLKGIVIATIFFLTSITFSKVIDSSIESLQSNIPVTKDFKNENNQSSYALGVSLGNYINNFFIDKKKLGMSLNKDILLSGIKDAIFFKSKFSNKKISQILNILEKKLFDLEKRLATKEMRINASQGERYMKDMLSKKDVQHSQTGLVFFIINEGEGLYPSKNDIVTVNYIGSFVNGTEFDNSYTRGKPLTFPLNSVILGWQEGLQHIKKGGKIKLVIPPSLAYGEKGVLGIPGNSTLVFEIELIDVKFVS